VTTSDLWQRVYGIKLCPFYLDQTGMYGCFGVFGPKRGMHAGITAAALAGEQKKRSTSNTKIARSSKMDKV